MTMINKDFLKQVFAGSKKLLELRQVKWIHVPVYDELAVQKIWPLIKEDREMMKFFPNKLPKGRLPDREYFWNIVNTLNEPYVTQLLKHANELRNDAKKTGEADRVIEVTDEWWDKLNAVPFMSSKCPLFRFNSL